MIRRGERVRPCAGVGEGVYRVFHRMVRLFEEEATRRRLRINIRGQSQATPRLFDSFETLPLVLIDNAIKYGTANTDVIVTVFDLQISGGCSVSVESSGDVVQPEHRERIFERRFRTPGARRTASSGSGLGLYVGQIVAKANRCEIVYEARDVHGDGSIGKNVFLLTVSDVSET